MSILSRVARAIDGFNERIGAMIRWLTLVMVLVGAATAVLRYSSRGLGLSFNLTPQTELQWYLFSLIFLLGAAYGLRHDVHVRVDVLYSELNPKKRAWIDLIGHVLFLIPFCIVMLYVSWPAVQNSFVLLVGQGYSQILKQVSILRGDGEQQPPTVDSQHEVGP